MKLDARIDAAVRRLQRLEVVIARGDAPWVGQLEASQGIRLPDAYRSLVARYRFPSFAIGPVDLFGNEGQDLHSDITRAPFADAIIATWMARTGYFQIGRSSCGSYDPIAVRQSSRGPGRDPSAVARFCHESILMEASDVPIIEQWPSFLDLLEDDPLEEMLLSASREG